MMKRKWWQIFSLLWHTPSVKNIGRYLVLRIIQNKTYNMHLENRWIVISKIFKQLHTFDKKIPVILYLNTLCIMHYKGLLKGIIHYNYS